MLYNVIRYNVIVYNVIRDNVKVYNVTRHIDIRFNNGLIQGSILKSENRGFFIMK